MGDHIDLLEMIDEQNLLPLEESVVVIFLNEENIRQEVEADPVLLALQEEKCNMKVLERDPLTEIQSVEIQSVEIQSVVIQSIVQVVHTDLDSEVEVVIEEELFPVDVVVHISIQFFLPVILVQLLKISFTYLHISGM